MIRPPLHSRLRAVVPSTVGAVLRALALRYPDDRPRAAGDRAQVRDVVDQAVRLSLDLLRRHDGAPEEFVESCREAAATAARRHRPPHEVVAYPEVVASALQTVYWQQAEPGDHLELAAYTARASAVVDQLRQQVQRAYFEQLRRDGFDPGAERRVAAALVRGTATPEVLWAAGRPPAPRYRVVLVRADTDTDAEVAVGDAVAALPGVVRCRVDADVVVLEPEHDTAPERSDDEGVAARLRADGRLARSAMVAGTAEGAAGVPEEVRTLQQLLGLVVAVGRVGRVCTRSDLVLESRLLTEAAAVRRLRALVAPVAHDPELVRTLQTLYLNDLDRTRTARELGIARRTLAYRLERVEELAGMPPAGARAVQVLGVGLAAYRARGLSAAPDQEPTGT